MPDKLYITKDGSDVVDDSISLENGKANLFGWSTYELWRTEHAGEDLIKVKIGYLYCGSPINLADGYGFRIEKSE